MMRAMAGPPHHTCMSGLLQSSRPSLPYATRPPCWCEREGLVGLTSFSLQPPVMKQTSPVPRQSPAAIEALPSTLSSWWFTKSAGAVQRGEPSRPLMARITPWLST
jgi:hypothetical protein